MVKLKFFLIISACLSLCYIGRINPPVDTILKPIIKKPVSEEDANTKLNRIANKHEVIGMCISYVQKNTKPQISVFGKRNLTYDLPVNENTLFKVASISKVVTAIAVMQLVENGELDLNKDISFYLKKSFSHTYFRNTPITSRMLLSHTSSIKDGKDYDSFLERTHSQGQFPSIYELINEGSDIWLNRKPGTFFNYSNLNYGILATIIEIITGERFDEYVDENILKPLEIDGGFNIQKIKSKEKISPLYRGTVPQVDYFKGIYPNYKFFPPGVNGVYFSPQSGLRISIKDLSKILRLFLNKGKIDSIRILQEESITLMEKEYWKYNGNNGDTYTDLFLSWGLGLQKTTNQIQKDYIMHNLNFIGHHGEAYGLIADMYYNRKNNFGFIFISNGTYNTSGYTKGNKSQFYRLEEEIYDFIFSKYVSKIGR